MSEHSEGDSQTGSDPFGDYLSDIEADRRWRAFHEAGHVVVAWALGALSVRADILEKPPRRGVTVYMLGAEGRGCSVQETIVASAGMSAAKRHAPWFQDGGEDDRISIARSLRALCRTDDAAEIVRLHCRAEADRLVTANWDAVEAVAAALLEHEAVSCDAMETILADVLIDRANAAEPARRKAWADLLVRAAAAPSTTSCETR